MTQKANAAAAPVHAVDVLIEDHDKVRALLEALEKTSDGREKRRLALDIFHEIEVHAKIEEELFYPALRRRADDEEFKKMLDESIEEHHVADVLVQELKTMSTTDRRYDAKFKVLMEVVEHHAEEQEQETFPKARTMLTEDGQALGARLMARKQELTPATAARRAA